MKYPQHKDFNKTIIACSLAMTLSSILVACHSVAAKDPSVSNVRLELGVLQANKDLQNKGGSSLREAEIAVENAEKSRGSLLDQKHLAYLASNKIKKAHDLASAQYADEKIVELSHQRDQIQLSARTAEADSANAENEVTKRKMALAEVKQKDLEKEKSVAVQQAQGANTRAYALQQELLALNAKKTNRGLVLTLNDVLFETGRSDIKDGTAVNLDRLVSALKQYPEIKITVEGHTDSVGDAELNQTLSQQRSDSVMHYLEAQGVESSRVDSIGQGEGFPTMSNKTKMGRQKNRRVEIIFNE